MAKFKPVDIPADPEETLSEGLADSKATLKIVGAESELETSPPSDAFDISSLWIDPGLGDALTETVTANVPVDKPKDFFRVHPDPAYRRSAKIYAHKIEGQIETTHYILGPKMRDRLPEARPCTLVTCIYRDGSYRIWPLMYPRDGEKDNAAWTSSRAAARVAMKQWILLVWNNRSYDQRPAQPGYAPDPDLSKLPTFDALIRAAFGLHGVIQDTQHPIWRARMGEPPVATDDGADL